jgi:hypothetical protein
MGVCGAVVHSDHVLESLFFRCIDYTLNILDLKVDIVRSANFLQLVQHRASIKPHRGPIHVLQVSPLRLPEPYADGAVLLPRASS